MTTKEPFSDEKRSRKPAKEDGRNLGSSKEGA